MRLPATRYTRTAIALHWIVALMVLGNLAFGLYLVGLPLSPQKLRYFSWHKWIGVTVFALATVRLLWRLRHAAPELPASMPQWERRAANASHTLLYVLVFAAPLSGWLFSSAAGFQTVYLGLLPIPDLLAKNRELADVLKTAHHWINYTMAAVVALHVAAALKHRLIDRDDVLARMLPGAAHVMRAAAIAMVLALAAAGNVSAQAPQKIVAAKSSIRFVSKQMNVPVEGQFKRFDATVAFDPAKPEATRAEFEVDLASIDMNSDEGETEARRKPWLNVEAFPKARFVASSVKQVAPGRFEARGALTLKGVSQEVVAPFTLAEAAGLRTVEGQFTLKRLLFKIGEGPWSDTETVADEVLVRFRFALPANR